MSSKDITDQQVEKALTKVPPAIQEYLTSDDLSDVIKALGATFELRVDQLGVLYDHCVYILLNLLQGDQFATSLQEELGIEEEKALILTDAANENIFIPARNMVLGINEEKQSEASKEANIPLQEVQNPNLNPKPKENIEKKDVIEPAEKIEQKAPERAAKQPVDVSAPRYDAHDPYREPIGD